MTERYCGTCGRPLGAADHATCAPRPALDPPRYCPQCGLRLDVQVYPDRVVARCRRCQPRRSIA